ncbi:hypothetical protein DSM3645_24942 [Blastopirellula marina DSM 3645]|uniref:Uncharacterized protein n=1 Tax=Blastopirellula marina DSM 3645 TaxID=314230 RepID=A4A0R8_9BACT|nr:hypothetical protein DSM3645_24942 [Blastopirellula marina DSM 3645]
MHDLGDRVADTRLDAVRLDLVEPVDVS